MKSNFLGNLQVKGRHGRVLTGYAAILVYVTGVIMSIYHIYYLGVAIIDPWLFRAAHLSFALVMIFLITPATKKSPRDTVSFLDIVLSILPVIVYIYIHMNLDELNLRAGIRPTEVDLVMAITITFLVMEGARRYFGPVLPIVSGTFLVYAIFGNHIPGMFKAADYAYERVFSYIFSTTGIYGVAIRTSSNYVFLFVLFGAFLLGSGAADVFMDIAKAATGKFRGGPAKISVVSSGLFGSITGSASSNVVTTGSFTIPLMKKTGYTGVTAAGIETAASIGGLFLPPIMGAGGFLIAEILQIPYLEVVRAAVVPALFYYAIMFVLVDIEALRLNLKGIAKSELPKLFDVLWKKGYLLIPVLVLLYYLIILRTTPIRAGLWSIGAMAVVAQFKKESRMSVKDILDILADGAKMALNVSTATACAGIIVGIVSLTGVGLTISSVLIALGGETLFVSLVMAMVVAIILGMGLPITATYITVAAILAPALTRLGVEPIAAHLFLYYFAAVSGMTPPVCVTAFAAGGVSGEDPMKIAFSAIKLGWVAYVLPYIFVYGKPLLLIGETSEIIIAIVTGILGALCIAAALTGYVNRRILYIERGILGISGVLLISVGLPTNIAGLAILVLYVLFYKFSNKSKLLQNDFNTQRQGES